MGGDIEWNIEALEDDAQAWRCVSNKLGGASRLLGQPRLTPGDFMSFLPTAPAAQANVASALAAMQSFAAQGAAKADQGAQVLLEVAAAYEANEDEARSALDGMWEPEEK